MNKNVSFFNSNHLEPYVMLGNGSIKAGRDGRVMSTPRPVGDVRSALFKYPGASYVNIPFQPEWWLGAHFDIIEFHAWCMRYLDVGERLIGNFGPADVVRERPNVVFLTGPEAIGEYIVQRYAHHVRGVIRISGQIYELRPGMIYRSEGFSRRSQDPIHEQLRDLERYIPGDEARHDLVESYLQVELRPGDPASDCPWRWVPNSKPLLRNIREENRIPKMQGDFIRMLEERIRTALRPWYDDDDPMRYEQNWLNDVIGDDLRDKTRYRFRSGPESYDFTYPAWSNFLPKLNAVAGEINKVRASNHGALSKEDRRAFYDRLVELGRQAYDEGESNYPRFVTRA